MSFMLQQIARLLLPFGILFGLAMLLRGHDDPGGGFVAGLSLAAAGILCITAFGTRRFRAVARVAPEQVALLGSAVLLASVLLPLVIGDASLTHRHGEIGSGDFAWKWHSAYVFEAGVIMTVGGGLAAAALWLWETALRSGEDE